jgi:hypothetical protein
VVPVPTAAVPTSAGVVLDADGMPASAAASPVTCDCASVTGSEPPEACVEAWLTGVRASDKRESSPAATVPADVPTFFVAAVPRPRFVRAVEAAATSERLFAACRAPVMRESFPAAAVPEDVP